MRALTAQGRGSDGLPAASHGQGREGGAHVLEVIDCTSGCCNCIKFRCQHWTHCSCEKRSACMLQVPGSGDIELTWDAGLDILRHHLSHRPAVDCRRGYECVVPSLHDGFKSTCWELSPGNELFNPLFCCSEVVFVGKGVLSSPQDGCHFYVRSGCSRECTLTYGLGLMRVLFSSSYTLQRPSTILVHLLLQGRKTSTPA